jgi:hypothetical protein
MTIPASGPADQVPGDLPARVFRALYQGFDLHDVSGIFVAVPAGSPCFAGSSLGELARKISAHADAVPVPAARGEDRRP